MKLITSTAMAAALILALPACEGQAAAGGNDAAATEAAGDLSVLNGTWKTDIATLKFEQKPDEFLLQDGTYKCNSCTPPYSTAADGQFHAVADRPYWDSMSVKAVDDKTVEIHRKKGDAEVASVTMTVSDDGNTLTTKFHDATTPNNPIDGTGTSKRVGPAPAGAHAVSGQWQPDQIPEYSESALSNTYTIDGNKVTSTLNGQTYTAEIGGPEVAVGNDTAKTMVKVTREGANGLRETFSRDGKVVFEGVTVPSSDGQSVTFTGTDPRDGSKITYTANKTS